LRSSPKVPSFPNYMPWILFGVFASSNFLLAYGAFSIETKLWIGILGFIIPLLAGLAISTPQDRPSLPWTRKDLLPPISQWALAALGLAAIYLRFHQMTTLSLWPLEDEAMNGHYAIELAERGNWKFTYDFSGMPPLYVWSLGLFFKIFGISLGSLWFFPALLSCFATAFAYAGARKFFSSSFSLLFAVFIAFSFWPLYVARFSLQGQFLFFWECLTFYLGGLFWKKRTEKSSLLLGLCSGLGFYTFTSWAVVAFLLTLFIFGETVLKAKNRWKLFFYFFLPQVLLFLPLAWVTATQKGGHFQYIFQNPFGPHWTGLNDLSSIFWGSRLPPNLFAYRPFWGGFLNPVLGSLCFWGAIALSKSKPYFPLWKLAGLFFLLILPGFLTGGMDGHRIVQVMPFLFFIASAGLASLLIGLALPWRISALVAVMALSFGLDIHHLFGVYHSLWLHPDENVEVYKPVERARAFQILKDLNAKEGPGYVLSELVPDTFDQSLSVAAYPFNAAQNPKISPSAAKWAALLVNVHYQSNLIRQFPEGKGVWLAPDMGRPDGGFMLEVIPLPSSHSEVLNRWIQADRALYGLADQVYDNHDWKPREPIIQSLDKLYPLFQGDPFLESCFWEKIAENEYADRHYEAQVLALQTALQKGVPAAHLFNDLGALLMRRGHLKEARQAFSKALQCVPNHTSAAAALALLNRIEKTGQKPQD
jgi:hypothetical protein